jgi:hypothetical protein
VRRVRFLGEEDQYKNWLDLFCAWIEAHYGEYTIDDSVVLSNFVFVSLTLNTILICTKYVSFPLAIV